MHQKKATVDYKAAQLLIEPLVSIQSPATINIRRATNDNFENLPTSQRNLKSEAKYLLSNLDNDQLRSQSNQQALVQTYKEQLDELKWRRTSKFGSEKMFPKAANTSVTKSSSQELIRNTHLDKDRKVNHLSTKRNQIASCKNEYYSPRSLNIKKRQAS